MLFKCPQYDRCGACSLLDVDYSSQLDLKRREVADSFASFSIDITVHDTIGMDDPYHYRNKVISCVGMRDGRTVTGMFEENSHKIVPLSDCLLQDSSLNAILSDIRAELVRLKIRPCGCGGVLKSILLRSGRRTGQVMVVFVTSEEMFHGRGELVRRITLLHPEIRSVVQNVNPRRTSVVLGEREKVLYGSGYIYDDLLGHRFKISPKSFYQINPVQTEKLYEKTLELASISKTDLVFDAYCGIGTIGISASSGAGFVLGVEVNPDAVHDAVSNARLNGVVNSEFVCADVSDFMRDFRERVDVLVLDPPRSGCDSSFLQSVLRMAPRKLVYISCDPHTQARDIRVLNSLYDCSDAYPFDMFPHTSHIENVVLLWRR